MIPSYARKILSAILGFAVVIWSPEILYGYQASNSEHATETRNPTDAAPQRTLRSLLLIAKE